MSVRVLVAIGLLGACATPETPPLTAPAPLVSYGEAIADAAPADAPPDAAIVDAPADAEVAAIDTPSDAAITVTPAVAPPQPPEVWLRGSTHVHAKPSGDSRTPVPAVIRWYESRGYDFIVLTDHNRVSEIDPTISTLGQVAARAPSAGLIVIAGIELTYNPVGCIPAGDPSGKCRIHVNLLGVTARPAGKLEWANRKSDDRVDKYQAAIDQQKLLGGIAQVNHPSWFWGMTVDVLAEIARRGIPLFEVANVQFEKWNTGDKDHPSLEALWDAALARGVTLWGVASDDAHHYDGGGRYPAGGGWVVVRARRDPKSILDSLAAGRFYSSTGVTLSRAEVEHDELVVEVAKDRRAHAIAFIENGKLVATVKATSARRALPATGYLRAVVTRADGAKAWIQPARR